MYIVRMQDAPSGIYREFCIVFGSGARYHANAGASLPLVHTSHPATCPSGPGDQDGFASFSVRRQRPLYSHQHNIKPQVKKPEAFNIWQGHERTTLL